MSSVFDPNQPDYERDGDRYFSTSPYDPPQAGDSNKTDNKSGGNNKSSEKPGGSSDDNGEPDGSGDGESRTGTPPPPPPPGGDHGNPTGGVNVNGRVPPPGDGPGATTDSGTGIEAAPTEWDVTREQTVAGQMEDIYDRDSPFFDQARERATRAHLAGGGQNSLMAAQAGEMAAMDQAFKIAFADASTYARSAEFNAAMKNQFGLAE